MKLSRRSSVAPARLLATVAAGGGLVALAVLNPASGASSPGGPRAESVRQSALTTATLSCPGPELSGIADVPDIDVPAVIAAGAAPTEAISPLIPQGRSSLTWGHGASAVDAERGQSVVRKDPSGDGVAVTASGALAPGFAASQEWMLARPEVRGLVTVPCARPGADLWLIAGGGAPGRQERLILVNPGGNEVSADIQVIGAKGPVVAPRASTVVPAHGRAAVLVDAKAGDEAAPVVRVRATGGAVRAVISDMWLDGSVAAGAESTGPVAPPATTQVIPAALMTGTGSVRVGVPGATPAVVSARVLGPDGPIAVPGGVVRIGARSSGEVPVGAVKPGTYAVVLTAKVPIVAAQWSSTREGKGPGDFLWSPAVGGESGLVGGVYPAADGSVPVKRAVSLVSSEGSARVEVRWRSGEKWSSRDVNLDADTSATVDLGSAQAVWVRRLSGSGAVRAGVLSQAGEGTSRLVSSSPLTSAPSTSSVRSAFPVR